MPEISSEEFANWLRPAAVMSSLPSNWDEGQKRKALLMRLSNGLISSCARSAIIWNQRHTTNSKFEILGSNVWAGSFGSPPEDFWIIGDAQFDNGVVGVGMVFFEDDPPDKYGPTSGVTLIDVRLNPSDVKDQFGWPHDPTPATTPGRKPAPWWPSFAEELAVYVHEKGIPGGRGSEGNEQVIQDVLQLLSDRGVEAARTTIQPVIGAVIGRIRDAGN